MGYGRWRLGLAGGNARRLATLPHLSSESEKISAPRIKNRNRSDRGRRVDQEGRETVLVLLFIFLKLLLKPYPPLHEPQNDAKEYCDESEDDAERKADVDI